MDRSDFWALVYKADEELFYKDGETLSSDPERDVTILVSSKEHLAVFGRTLADNDGQLTKLGDTLMASLVNAGLTYGQIASVLAWMQTVSFIQYRRADALDDYTKAAITAAKMIINTAGAAQTRDPELMTYVGRKLN